MIGNDPRSADMHAWVTLAAVIAALAGCDGRATIPASVGGVPGMGKSAGLSRCGAIDAQPCLMDPPYAGVWESGPNDVWIVESDFQEVTARHWNGNEWTPYPIATVNTLSAVWGSAPDDIWAVGAAGTIVHWDGTAWSPQPSGTQANLSAVWGSRSGDVWAVGSNATSSPPSPQGVTLHWDGTGWSQVVCCDAPDAGSAELRAIWGSAASDVWAVGAAGSAIHWDGVSWNPVTVTASDNTLTSIWGSSSHDVWIGGAGELVHYDGTGFTSAPFFGTVDGLWGSAANDVWNVAASGVVNHWDGREWALVSSGTTNDLAHVWGSGAAEAWAVGPAGTVLNWNGLGWSVVADGSAAALGAVWGNGANDVWASGPIHWDGSAWTQGATANSVAASGLCGFAPDDVWAVGQGFLTPNGTGYIAHWDGLNWTIDGIDGVYVPAQASATSLGPSEMRAAWCGDRSDVWAVGKMIAITGPIVDTIAHWDGTTWSPVANPMLEPLSGVWGSSTGDIWAAGDSGTLLHWDATAWSVVPSGVTADLGAVWGSGADDVWVVVRGQGEFLHWDGSAWSLVADGTTGSSSTLSSIAGTAPDDVWAVGEIGNAAGGVAVHWDGRRWSTSWSTPPAVPTLNGVWAGAGSVFLVAGNGMIFQK